MLSLFSVGFDAAGGRMETLSSDGASWGVDQDQFGNDNGIRVDLAFRASSSNKTVTLLPHKPGVTFHLYGMALAFANNGGGGIAMSADGQRLVTGANPGRLYTSSDSGATWIPRLSVPDVAAVAASADGSRLLAAVSGGQVYTSADSGATWQAQLDARQWRAVACSTDGRRLGAASLDGSGRIQISDDYGVTWTGQAPTPGFGGIAFSGDGARAFAGGYGAHLFTLAPQFANYAYDPVSGLILDQSGHYISTVTNTALAKVPSPLPLRLILHYDDTQSRASLLQRVFVGRGANSANLIVANREALLDPTALASARRLSATHLPFSVDNRFWTDTASFAPGSVVTFTVPTPYDDQAGNPFLHTFHPDHDNLDATFKSQLPAGVESYDLTRTIRLTFGTRGTDFRSLTAGPSASAGTYEETITLGGASGAQRQFRLAGSFQLRRITPTPTLTTQ